MNRLRANTFLITCFAVACFVAEGARSRAADNADGDVSLREFLGGIEQFKKIDKTADGFIDPQEARAAN